MAQKTLPPRAGSRKAIIEAISQTLIVASVLSVALVFWAAQRTGSLGAGWAYLRGDQIYLTSSRPIPIPAETGSATVTLLNLSDNQVRIVGYNNPCLCVNVRGLPLTIEPHAQSELIVEAASGSEGLGTVDVMFLTDHAEQPTIAAEFLVLP